MRASIITFFFVVIISHTNAQLIVANDKMNIVYAGVDNPISFLINGYDSKKLILEASCGELTKTEKGYSWKLCGQLNYGTVKFSCFYKTGGVKKLAGTSDYRIKKVPDPIPMTGGSGYNHFGYNPRLPDYCRVELQNFDFDMRFSVKEFDIEFYKKSRDTLRIKNIGSKISYESYLEMKKLKPGERFCFKNIIAFNDCEVIDRKIKNEAVFNPDGSEYNFPLKEH